MKILVVDDERSFGSLLGRALKKLGHKASIACHPIDALALLDKGVEQFDAVITDIDMPEMNGVDLARAIRSRVRDIPIAFSTGSAPDDQVLRAAASLGKVLPKVWTVADVRKLVEDLDRLRVARGSARMPRLPRAPSPNLVSRREPLRRMRLVMKTWDEVGKLCDRQSTEAPQVTLRGSNPVSAGEHVVVALTLPDELALSIGAEVVSCTRDPGTGKFVFAIRLLELTPEVCTRLRSMCVPERAQRAQAQTRPAQRRSGKILGGLRARTRA